MVRRTWNTFIITRPYFDRGFGDSEALASVIIMDRSSRYITITEEDLKSLLNESNYKWYHVNDVTAISRFASDVKSHPISDDMDLNQYNNIHKITKFHTREEFREHLKETNESRIHYANYKEIDNYWDFVGFKHKLIDRYHAIGVEEEDKQEVFIRGQKAYKKNYGDKEILFGTQAIFSEGISVNALSVLILGTPINNEPLLTQLIGRVIREQEGKPTPAIVDIHLKGNTARTQASNRMGYYMKQGWKIQQIG